MGTSPIHPLEPRRVIGRETQPFDRAAPFGGDFLIFPSFFFRGSFAFAAVLISLFLAASSPAQDLTPLDTAIRTGTTEQKRDALFQIRNLRSEIASRTAIPALRDPDPMVRATAASSVVFLRKLEAIAALSPLLADKLPFVRKEAAYSLGKVESPDAAAPLLALIDREKDLEVKAAAAFALGFAGNPTALAPLIKILNDRPKEETEFLRRSAARSIGQIAQSLRTGNPKAVTPQSFLPDKFKDLSTGADLAADFNPATKTLEKVLGNRKEADDTRREAAFALGAIASRNAIAVLETSRNSPDPYLAEIARESLATITIANPAN